MAVDEQDPRVKVLRENDVERYCYISNNLHISFFKPKFLERRPIDAHNAESPIGQRVAPILIPARNLATPTGEIYFFRYHVRRKGTNISLIRELHDEWLRFVSDYRLRVGDTIRFSWDDSQDYTLLVEILLRIDLLSFGIPKKTRNPRIQILQDESAEMTASKNPSLLEFKTAQARGKKSGNEGEVSCEEEDVSTSEQNQNEKQSENISGPSDVHSQEQSIRTCQPQPSNNGASSESRPSKADNMLYCNKLHGFVEYETVELAEKAIAELNEEGNWRNGLRVRSLLKPVFKTAQARGKKSGNEGEVSCEEEDVSTSEQNQNEKQSENISGPSDVHSHEQLFGFFGGIHLAISSAFVQMSPDSCLSAFVMYFNRPWSKPIPTPGVLQNGMMLIVQDLTRKDDLAEWVVSEDGKKVKRLHPLTGSDMEELQACIIVAENLPDDHCHQKLMKVFSTVGSVKTLKSIRTCQPQPSNNGASSASRPSKADNMLYCNKLHAFVEYETVELAEKAIAELNEEGNWRNGLRVRSLLKPVSKTAQARGKKSGNEGEVSCEEEDVSTSEQNQNEKQSENISGPSDVHSHEQL